MNFNIDWGFTFAVVVVGLVVVFVVLLILVALCTLTGVIFKSIDKNKKEKATPSAPVAVQKPQSAPSITVAVAQPKVESGIPGDVVAAISAAVACVMGGETKFAVKSIKRARGARPAWNAAGIADNTRPF